MLIINARLHAGHCVALRIEGEHIVERAPGLRPRAGEEVFNAAAAAVLPGLHDHHSHLLAYAAALESVACGPPQLSDAVALFNALAKEGAGTG